MQNRFCFFIFYGRFAKVFNSSDFLLNFSILVSLRLLFLNLPTPIVLVSCWRYKTSALSTNLMPLLAAAQKLIHLSNIMLGGKGKIIFTKSLFINIVWPGTQFESKKGAPE